MMTQLDGPQREPAINLPPIVTAMLATLVVVHAIRSLALPEDLDNFVVFYGAFIPARYLAPVSQWRIEWLTTPLSYSLLHAGWTHLINNAVWLAAFGSLIARLVGAGKFLVLWSLTAAVAALTHFFVQPDSMAPLVGASGAISGMMGAAARTGMNLRTAGAPSALPPLREVLSNRSTVSFLAIYLLMNVGIGVVGLAPSSGVSSIAWQAHIGGLVAGFILLPLLASRKQR